MGFLKVQSAYGLFLHDSTHRVMLCSKASIPSLDLVHPEEALPNSFLPQASQAVPLENSSSSPHVHLGCPGQPAFLVSSLLGDGVWVFSPVSGEYGQTVISP